MKMRPFIQVSIRDFLSTCKPELGNHKGKGLENKILLLLLMLRGGFPNCLLREEHYGFYFKAMSHLLHCSIQNIPVLNQTKLNFFPSCFCIAGLIPRYRRSAEIPHHLKGLELAGEILAVELTGGSGF